MKGKSLVNTTIKHSIKGRVRLSSKELVYLKNQKNIIEKEILENKYINSAILNNITGSILVTYDSISIEEVHNYVDKVINKYSVSIYEQKKN